MGDAGGDIGGQPPSSETGLCQREGDDQFSPVNDGDDASPIGDESKKAIKYIELSELIEKLMPSQCLFSLDQIKDKPSIESEGLPSVHSDDERLAEQNEEYKEAFRKLHEQKQVLGSETKKEQKASA